MEEEVGGVPGSFHDRMKEILEIGHAKVSENRRVSKYDMV